MVGEAIREKMRRDHAQNDLEQLLLEGLDSGETIPFDPKMYDRKKRELTKRFANRKRSA